MIIETTKLLKELEEKIVGDKNFSTLIIDKVYKTLKKLDEKQRIYQL